MSSDEAITHWLHQLKDGDSLAAQKLWESYFQQLVVLARSKLRGARRRVADEEDVALSAFDSFCRGVERGRFPRLADRDDLWHLLIVITARKAADQIAHERRLKRGGGLVRGESALLGPDGDPGLVQVVGSAPTPDFAAQVAEQCEYLLTQLGDEQLRHIATAKMEGYTNTEIAGQLGCVEVTVERRLRLIRTLWEKQTP